MPRRLNVHIRGVLRGDQEWARLTLADTQVIAQGSFAAIGALHWQSWANANNGTHGFADRAPNWIAVIGLLAAPNHVIGPATFDPATNGRWVASQNVITSCHKVLVKAAACV